MKTFVIGHRQPDLDSVVAAVAFAELAQARGYQEVIPLYSDQLNHETKTVFGRFGAPLPQSVADQKIGADDQVVLVDHNEASQRAPEVRTEQISEIIDHHKINLDLSRPIRVDIHPWGSTSTIIYDYFRQDDLQPTTQIAQLLLSGLLSDTLGLKSPTTTEIDLKAAQELAKTTGLKIEDLTLEIFRAKSRIDDLSPQEIITKDYKVFEFGGKKVFVNQVETVERAKALEQKDALVKALQDLKGKQSLDYAFCVLTDILQENSQLIYPSEADQRLAEKAFGGQGKDQVLDIGARLSRKKQIAPELEKALTK